MRSPRPKGEQALWRTAGHQLTAGNHARAGGHNVTAVAHYSAAWKGAFKALTQRVTKAVTSVPPSAIAAAAANALGSKRIGLAGPMIEKQQPLTRAGKPELFFAGAEGCPFCGVQRWGMIAALSQFGTFSNLHLMQSDTTEPPPVRTFTFYGSSYHSPYLAFVPVEIRGHILMPEIPHLQQPTAAEGG